jgi:hypothetical protein
MKHIFRKKFTWLFTLALAALVVLPFAAFADNINDDISDDVSSALLLTAGDPNSTGTARVKIVAPAGSGDGDAGCNIDSTSEVLTIQFITPSGVTATVLDGATATGGEMKFTVCEVFQRVQFSASAAATAGDNTVTANIVTNTTGGSYNNNVRIPIKVTVSNTAPSITVPGNITVEGNTLGGRNVTYSVSASDTQDGALTPACTPASGSLFPVGTTQVTCNVSDSGGLSDSKTFNVTVQDTTLPAITVPANITAEATGPTGAAVSYTASASDLVDGAVTPSCAPASGSNFALGDTTVTCNATDAAGNHAAATTFVVHVEDTTAPIIAAHGDETAEATSAAGAVVSYTSPATSDAVDGAKTASCTPPSGGTFPLGNTTVTCNATDAAGNHATATTFTVYVVDTTPPTITFVNRTAANANGWNNGNVTVNWSCSDSGSGVVSATVNAAVSTEGANQTATGTCTDLAGNSASDIQPGISIDKTAPIFGACPAGGPFLLNSGSQSVGPIAVDAAISGLNAGLSTLSGSVDTSSVGAKTVTFTAVDNAGNTAPKSCGYSVNYRFDGFLQPINDTAHQIGVAESKFRLGSTIPVKFQEKDASGAVVQQASTPTFQRSANLGPCDSSTVLESEVASTITTGTDFRWDITGSQYIYNWSTKNLTSGEYRIYANLADGSRPYVDICLTK